MNACRRVAVPVLALNLVALNCVALFLGGCDERADSGSVQSEARDIGEFDSIDMEGAARLEITVGKPASVVVKGREGAVRRVETEVHGDTLRIRSKPKDWFISDGKPRITVEITVPHLESLELEGGNDVRLQGFSGGESRISAAGAAHIKATGELDELTVRLAGAGHADFSQLVAGDAKVTVDGVGSVIVHPRDTLDATMNGVGAILYTGTPRQVNTRMNGLGTIGQARKEDMHDKDEGSQVEPEPGEIDPDTLQPEYEEPRERKKEVSTDSTEVI